MIVDSLYNNSNYKYIKNTIIKIENLRRELDNKVIIGIDNNEEILELSRELDELIVEYFKKKYRN